MFIAKNRNGPSFKSIPITINYDTMRMKQEEITPIGG